MPSRFISFNKYWSYPTNSHSWTDEVQAFVAINELKSSNIKACSLRLFSIFHRQVSPAIEDDSSSVVTTETL